MRTKMPMTDLDRTCGALALAAIGAMLGTGVAWAGGLGLLPGLGWGLIWGVIGLLIGTVLYFGDKE
jgi:uncharacterized membrane protein YjfL (UPF0719 family)